MLRPFKGNNMTKTALRRLISLGEGQSLEFKQSFPDDLGRELCAFANSAGGRILIGVADDGSIRPLPNLNKLVSQVQDYARNCEPPVAVEVQTIGGIIIVEVKSSRDKPHSSKGLFYLREGANAQRMSRTQIREYLLSSTPTCALFQGNNKPSSMPLPIGITGVPPTCRYISFPTGWRS